MLMSEVDFTIPSFPENPEGWQTANDLADGFLLAWALEVRERTRIDPSNPFGSHVLKQLPPAFRYDTLGQLIPMPLSAGAQGLTMPGRLTTLCIVWRLFDKFNQQWQLRPRDYVQFGNVLAFVTGGTDRRSLFGDLSADMAKCLLSDQVSRAHDENQTLSQGEEWFAKGDRQFLIDGEVIPFMIAGNLIRLYAVPENFVQSVWAAARVLVEKNSPDYYISKSGRQIPTLLDVLERGAVLAEKRKLLPPVQAWEFELWPGWPGER